MSAAAGLRSNTTRSCAFAAAGLALLVTAAGAQDLEPRLYVNAPPGLNFVVPGYAVSEGSVLLDPALELDNAAIEIDGVVFGYARSLSLAGKSAQVAIALGDVCLDGAADFEGQRYVRHACGLTDAKLRLSWNFIGAPALEPAQFASYEQDLIVGVSIGFNLPIGDYDPARLANIGTNRRALKTELGLSKALGRWTLELAAAGTFYETNSNFFGGKTQEQDPIYSVQGHVVHGFPSGIWLAVDATYYRGGATVTDDLANRNLQANSRVGLTVSVPLNRRQSVKLAASTGLATRTGSDFDTLALAWQYRWGAGI